MHPRRSPLFLIAAMAACLMAAMAVAQPPTTYPTPLLKAVLPPGGKVGTTVEVTVDGTDLDAATALYLSTPGVKAERIPDPPADPKKKTPAPLPIRFKVAIAADVAKGIHDVRVIGKWGISNPRAFAVGELPEIVEKEPNNDVPQAQKVELGTVINGVIGAKTDVDFFAFTGKAGQCIVAHCAATTIDSRLTAQLRLFTAADRELANTRFYRDGDAVLSCILPADGEYVLRLCNFAYLVGGPESVYRLTVSQGPWIDAVFPPVVAAGKASPVTLYGRNLPGGEAVAGMPDRQSLQVTVNAPAAATSFPGRLLPRLGMVDGFGHQLPGSNPVFLGLTDAAVTLDNGDNNQPAKAQPVPFPGDVCGRFERVGDRDYYAFDAKKGEVVVMEGYADRLRGTSDLYFVVRRADTGAVIGESDAHPNVPPLFDHFYTFTNDPLARVTIPADGTYHLLVGGRDAASRVGLRDVYRVSLRHEDPDFRLVMVGNHDNAAGLTLQRGASQDVQVVCFRQDGFDGEITLAAEGLPAGVSCEPQILGPKVQEGTLVLNVAADAKDWDGEFRVTGTAMVDGKKVTRPARTGCLVFPAGNKLPAVSRLSRSLCAAVRDPGPFHLSVTPRELALPIGGTATVKLKVTGQMPNMKDPVNVTLAAGPVQANGRPIAVGAINVAPAKEGDVRIAIPTNAPPGRYSLVLRGSGKYALDVPATKKKRNTQYATVTPPIVLTVYSSVSELAVEPGTIAIGAGGQVPVTVSVKRLHGYAGPIQLELVGPNNSGVSAAAVNLPANATNAKLMLKADAKAKLAKDLPFLVRATAKIDKVTLRDEVKVPVSIGSAAGTMVGVKATALLPEGAAMWRYAATVTGDDWRKPEFDDKAWKELKAPFGNGEPEVATRKGTEVPEKGQPVYARRTFDVPAELLKKPGVTFRLKVASDNSAAVYLNGKVADEDSGDHEFAYWNRDVAIPAAALQPGKNVIAVRVDNSAGSSDLYFDLTVIAETPLPKK